MKFLAVILVVATGLFALMARGSSAPDHVVQLSGVVDSAQSAARAR
jgi:hypothetical protein